MSVNIPSNLLRIARSATLVLDATKLGPNQLRAYRRMATSGAITSMAVPAKMAAAARKAAWLPTVRVAAYGSISWEGCPLNDENVVRIMTAMVGELTLAQANSGDPLKSNDKRVSQLMDAVNARHGAYKCWVGSSMLPILKKHVARMKLPPMDIVPELITVDLIDEKVPS